MNTKGSKDPVEFLATIPDLETIISALIPNSRRFFTYFVKSITNISIMKVLEISSECSTISGADYTSSRISAVGEITGTYSTDQSAKT